MPEILAHLSIFLSINIRRIVCTESTFFFLFSFFFLIFEIRQMKKQHTSANDIAASRSRHVARSTYLFGRVLIHHAYVLCRHVRASNNSDPPFCTYFANFLIRIRANPCA